MLHCLYGSPSKPGGHLHVALWFRVEHMADGLHGLSFVQGFIQLLSRHAWFVAHSESDEQPIGSGSTIKKLEFYDLEKLKLQQYKTI